MFWQRIGIFLKQKEKRGSMMLFVMVFGSIAFSIIVLTLGTYAISESQASRYKQNREEALQIAEAGITYYRWHLAHASTDYYDGQGATSTGPYVHDFKDPNGNVIGHYSLVINKPANGSTVVMIISTGWLDIQPDSKRTLKVRVGFPSLTDYAFLTNTSIWLGNTESVHGKLQSNKGIRFDGTADALIMSAMATYTCPDWQGCSGSPTKNGVWGSGGPSSFWQFPVPAQDFSAVTADLAKIKSAALLAGGGAWPYLSSSGKQGWRLQFLNDGTINVSKVNTCTSYSGYRTDGTFGTYCIDAATYGTVTNYVIPSSSFIYIDDNVWVDGVVNGRATVAAGTGKSIIINGNITYLAKDGVNVLGLIASQDVLVPHDSPSNLEIDAAMLAQVGAVQRFFYSGNKKASITTYGAILSYDVWTWNWNTPVDSGYLVTNSTYDTNLTYSPPGGFPVGSSYNLISWEEIRTIAAQGVTVSPSSINLLTNANQQFTVSVSPSNATNQNVTWSVVGGVNNGTITPAGLYTAPATPPGSTVVVQAVAQDGGHVGTANVVVTTPVAATGVTISPTPVSLLAGVTQQFIATILPVNATNQTVTWNVIGGASNGTINGSGIYTAPAISPGAAITVQATTQDGGFVASATVTIINPIALDGTVRQTGATNNTTAAVVSPSITTASAGELLVVVCMGSSGSGAITSSTVTMNTGLINFTRQVHASSTVTSAGRFFADIWTGWAAAKITATSCGGGTCKVTCTWEPSHGAGVVQVMALTNASSTVGATTIAVQDGGSNAVTSLALTTTKVNSLVIGAVSNYNTAAASPTVDSFTTLLSNYDASSKSRGFYTVNRTTVTNVGSYTVGTTAPNDSNIWAAAGLEILHQ